MSSSYPPFNYGGAALCRRCGAMLSPNEVYCGSCGYYNNVQENSPTERAQPAGPPWNSPQTSYGQYEEQARQFLVSSPQNSGYSQPPVSSPPSGMTFQHQPSFQQAPYAVAPAPVMTNGFQPGSIPGWPAAGVNQPATKPRRPNTGIFVGIALLLIVLLVGGGFAGYAYLNANSSQSTATSSSRPTVPTPTAKTPPLFADAFTNNTNGWNLQGKPGKFSVAVGDGFMTLEDDNNKLLWEVVPGGKIFSNFSLAVDATLSKGSQDNGYGVYIRGASNQNSDLATYYRFELYGDGTYAIFKGAVDARGNLTSTRLVDYTTSAAIQKQGASNHIVITANGSLLTLNVNGQMLSKIADLSYTSGSMALFVSNLQNAPPGAQAKFSQFVVYAA